MQKELPAMDLFANRGAGILLHPSSLPSPYGIGDFGPEAFAFVDWLAKAGQSYWQVLPLCPVTQEECSPYAGLSVHAGNPLLISPDLLWRDGLLAESTLRYSKKPPDKVDFPTVWRFKSQMMETVFGRFQRGGFPKMKAAFETFRHEQAAWLADYCKFEAVRELEAGRSWVEWHHTINDHATTQDDHFQKRIDFHAFQQFTFFTQWRDLKAYANERGIRIIGDIPIYVAHDSVDVWREPSLFKLDAQMRPRVVGGVPPDRFSETGQFWGLPVYDWATHAATGFKWWVDRFRANFERFDLVRIDHFRGFSACWEIPAGDANAVNGQWVDGPGESLFEALSAAFPNFPVFAEDLGVITPEVIQLRKRFKLPGVHVLQFAFEVPDEVEPPEPEEHCVLYTGTHDNNTSRGWFEEEADETRKKRFLEHSGGIGGSPHWDFISMALASKAQIAIVPLQDVMGLGSEARMNLPGRFAGNWDWRFEKSMLTENDREKLGELTVEYGRGKIQET